MVADMPPRVGLGADVPEWRWTDTRQFTCSSAYSFLSDMVSDQNWELVVCHSPRTCNLFADRLATWGRLNSQEALTLLSPPSSLLAVVEADKSGTGLDPLELQDWYGNAAAVCFALREDQGEVELLEMVSAGSEPVGIG
ncbi:hypothetical protein V6N13_080545 [Hibiscus sabdariffa]